MRASRRAACVAALAVASCVRAPSATFEATRTMAPSLAMTIPRAPSEYPLCPVAAASAAAEVQDVEGGVVVDVTASDDAAGRDVRARAEALLAALPAMGEGRLLEDDDEPGYGRCPVVLRGTTIATHPLDRGVRLVVLAKDASDVEWLRVETRARLAEARIPASSRSIGIDHCPSALPGAVTEVVDCDGGVVVRVTSRDPGVAAAVRGRALHVAREAGQPGSHGERAASAGRVLPCPVVLDGAAVVAREVPGGAEIEVRATLADAVPSLRREAHLRAAAFR